MAWKRLDLSAIVTAIVLLLLKRATPPDNGYSGPGGQGGRQSFQNALVQA